MDVDHFKVINDTYGHPVGDQVLQNIGKIITELCRTEDVACRFGGEEFVIIAPHTHGADAVIFAERVREILAATHFKPQGISSPLLLGQSIRVTASFGVSEAVGSYDRSMLQRADDAMYQAKQQGRNRVLMASPVVALQSAAA